MNDYTKADLARDRAMIERLRDADELQFRPLCLEYERVRNEHFVPALDALEAAWKRIAYLERFADRSPSEVCRLYGVQNCHFCDDMECGDNTSVTHERIARLEAAWAEVERLWCELLRYGGHEANCCNGRYGGGCSCGWRQAAEAGKEGA